LLTQTYTLFSVNCQSFFNSTSQQNTFNSFPLYYKPYADKYGLRRLQRYTNYVGFQNSSDKTTKNKLKIDKYQEDLFNWNIMNADFYSGKITVRGSQKYKVGDRLVYESDEWGENFEFYIESVSHEFVNYSYWVTRLGVTRGLTNRGSSRFSSPWGMSEVFRGGLFGMPVNNGQPCGTSSGGAGGSNPPSSGTVLTGKAEYIINTAKSYIGVASYSYGSGRTEATAQSGYFDCSSFVWWVYHLNGIDLGSQSSVTGDTLAQCGTPVNNLNDIQPGDLLFMNSDGWDGHVVIYEGDCNFIGCQSSGCYEQDINWGFQNIGPLGDIRRVI
jgi:cell wall-associated NlpC family hydrolase